jgi:hypothetical protein
VGRGDGSEEPATQVFADLQAWEKKVKAERADSME